MTLQLSCVCVCVTEVLGALCSILIIWVMTGILVYFAIERIIHQEHDINADQMLIVASLGIGFNIV